MYNSGEIQVDLEDGKINFCNIIHEAYNIINLNSPIDPLNPKIENLKNNSQFKTLKLNVDEALSKTSKFVKEKPLNKI